MAQRLLISGDHPDAVETIRRFAEESGLAVTKLGGEDAGDWNWRDDHQAYERQRETLGAEYEGRFIAMHRGEVLGVGDNLREAVREGIERLGETKSLFVIRAGEPLPEPEELDMQMQAPRSVDPRG
jgi:hypothetical protein